MEKETNTDLERRSRSTPVKVLFVILGLISVVLAYIGILLPGVPAIPFILLAAFFFLRSSDRLYAWMARQRFLGKLLRKSGEKTSLGFKLFVISQLWVSITVAYFLFIEGTTAIVTTVAGGVVFSIIIFRLMK